MAIVLLIQPDAGLRRDWTTALAAEGLGVVTVASVPDGLARLQEGGVDILVLDTPEHLDAIETLAGTLACVSDMLPTLVVSASPDGGSFSARIGAAGFVPKPCEATDVCREVVRLTAVVRPAVDDEPTAPNQLGAGVAPPTE